MLVAEADVGILQTRLFRRVVRSTRIAGDESVGHCERWFNPDVKKDHRRELYSPTSPDALQMPDVTGPDGVRVTLRVEPAVDRLRRWRYMFFTPRVLTDPLDTYVSYRALPDIVQRRLLGNRWAVDVEADTGERCRVMAGDRDLAVTYAQQIREGIQNQGVPFLKTFAR